MKVKANINAILELPPQNLGSTNYNLKNDDLDGKTQTSYRDM
jgi:hypothetical protein